MIRIPKPAAFKKNGLPPLAPVAALLVMLLPATSPRAAANPATAPDLAPADALLFLSLPDPVHTVAAWPGTELFKLWREPEIQTFLERPLSRVPVNETVRQTWARLGKIEPREVFLAVVPGPEKGDQPRMVAGFRFNPKHREELDALLELPKTRLRASFPGGQTETVDYRGQPVEIFRTGRAADLLASATRAEDGWYLLSSDLDMLRAAVDRLLEGPKPEHPALGTEADFRAVRGRLPADLEALTFVRPAAMVKLVPDSAPVPPAYLERLRDIRAAGASTAFAPGGQIRDVLFSFTPDQPVPAAGPLELPALGLATAADTVFFGSARLSTRGSPGASGTALGAALGGILAGRGVTPERFGAAFGEEVGLVVDWASGSSVTPTGTLAVPLRDRAAAEEVLGKFVAVPFQESRWEPRTLPGGTMAYALRPGGGGANLTPTLALGSRFLFLAASPESAQAALDRERDPAAAGGKPLMGAERYRAAVAGLGPGPNSALAYLDWATLFERAYAAARPMFAVSALVFPKLSEFVDADQLPSAAVVSRHLGPATLNQRGTGDGILLESTGPLPLTQAAGLSVVSLYLGAMSEGFRSSPRTPGTGKKTPAPEASASPD